MILGEILAGWIIGSTIILKKDKSNIEELYTKTTEKVFWRELRQEMKN